MSDDKKLDIRADHDGSLAVVRIIGPIVRDNQIHLRKELERLVSDGITQLAIDLKQVDYMDSAGLGTLIAVLKRVTEKGGDMKIACLQKKPRMVFEITRAYKVFEIYDTVEEALKAFS